MAFEMKNMAYWKRKNALPGINHESDKNLPDGRSTSSPFQEKETPKKKPWWTKEGWRGRQDARSENRGQRIEGRADRKIEKLDADKTDLDRGMKKKKVIDKANRKITRLQHRVEDRELRRLKRDQRKAGKYEGSRRQKRDIAKYNKEKGLE